MQAKFTSALIYPAFVAVVGIGIMFFFMTYMLPKFMTIFQGMNVALPFVTHPGEYQPYVQALLGLMLHGNHPG